MPSEELRVMLKSLIGRFATAPHVVGTERRHKDVDELGVCSMDASYG